MRLGELLQIMGAHQIMDFQKTWMKQQPTPLAPSHTRIHSLAAHKATHIIHFWPLLPPQTLRLSKALSRGSVLSEGRMPWLQKSVGGTPAATFVFKTHAEGLAKT